PKPVQKKAPVKKKPVVKKKPARVSKKPLKTVSPRAASKSGNKARKTVVSRDPKAGGGYGKGNTANRNVKQVGILSMLGDSKGSKVQPAIAEVTNLDAVRSSNSGQAKFKVGGIKGKLGTSEISVTGGDVVATKGNSQVLRSYGAGGSGRVAALQKGSVGQKQVKGMVQARLNKSVRIRGGMSREAVKRVIEQHLDEITYCYETALISNPSLKGKITMEWKIRMSGGVGEVRIKSSTIKSPEIYGCIKSAIKTWQFPKPVGNEVVVSYPFIFDIVGF
ncbi:MAG: AgmX/PglI C-terminal domain-containing protein, partial [Deltaproteobacteria bacterium]|nr:AgmX/PglI C-terminal domain-containing protein [Deltaproteobacteria bacterium]